VPPGVTTDLDGEPRFFSDTDVDGTPDNDAIVDLGAYEAQYGWYMTYGDDQLSAGREYRSGYHDSKTISDTLALYNIDPFLKADQSYALAITTPDTPPGITLADVFLPRLDSRWEIDTGELLAGNDDMLKSMDMRFSGEYPSLNNQIDNQIAALNHYTTAIDAYLSLLAVSDYYTRFLQIQPDRLSYLLDVTNPQSNPYHDVQRLAGAIAKESEAALKLAQSYFRQYTPASKELAEQTLRAAHDRAVDRLALLDHLTRDWEEADENTTYATAYQALTQSISDMDRVFEFLQQGKNPFGFNPGYIPFMIGYDNSADPENVWNFVNVHNAAYADSGSYFDLAEEKYEDLLDVQRDLDDDQTELGDVLGELVDEYQGPLGDLCGTEGDEIDLAGCDGGTIGEQVLVIQGAILRFRQAEVAMANQLELIRIEQQRAAEVAGIHLATAIMYSQDGETLATLTEDEANLKYCKSDMGVALDVMGEFTDVFIEGGMPTDPFSLVGMLGVGVLKGIIQTGKNMEERAVADKLADIARQRGEIDARQKAHVAYAEAAIVDADSEALIKEYMLEYATLKLDRAIAFNDLQQALHRLNAMTSQVEYLLARWAEAKGNAADLYMDPGARLYRDWLSEVAQDYYDQALEWAFSTSRALDYEMGEPWQDAEDIFEIVDIDNLGLAYDQMGSDFDEWKPQIPPEPDYTTIPLSQAMGFADSWEIIESAPVFTTARQKFKAYVSNPENWVDLNNDGTASSLRLTFQTSIFYSSDELNLFSTGVFNDKIMRVAPVLIGEKIDLDGGGDNTSVRIKQLGTCYLRTNDSVIGGQDSFSAYDFEHAVKEGESREARITSYYGWINDESLDIDEINNYGSLGLLWRSVGCTEWVLTIAKEGIDAENSDINFAGLEDILLYIKHRNFALETPSRPQILALPNPPPAVDPRLMADPESAYRYFGSLIPESPERLSPIEVSMYLEQSGNDVSAVIEPAGLLAFPVDDGTGLGPELHGSSVGWSLNLTSNPFGSTEGITRTLSLTTTVVYSDGQQISGNFVQSIIGLVPDTIEVRGVFTFTRSNEAPIAAFNATPSTGPASSPVQFNNWSQGEPTSYLWDFGDQSTSTDFDPAHVYIQPGTYTVTLQVDSLFGSDTLVQEDFIVITEVDYRIYLPIVLR